MKWHDIVASDKYKQAAPEEKSKVRSKYFNDFIKTREDFPEDNPDLASRIENKFVYGREEGEVKEPGLMDKAWAKAPDLMEGVKDLPRKARSLVGPPADDSPEGSLIATKDTLMSGIKRTARDIDKKVTDAMPTFGPKADITPAEIEWNRELKKPLESYIETHEEGKRGYITERFTDQAAFLTRIDMDTKNLIIDAYGKETLMEMADAQKKLNAFMVRAPRIAMAVASPIKALLWEGLVQVKNVIVSKVKGEEYDALVSRFLTELLPEDTKPGVKAVFSIAEMAGDIALVHGIESAAKQGLLNDALNVQVPISKSAIKEAARGTTIEKAAKAWLQTKQAKLGSALKKLTYDAPKITGAGMHDQTKIPGKGMGDQSQVAFTERLHLPGVQKVLQLPENSPVGEQAMYENWLRLAEAQNTRPLPVTLDVPLHPAEAGREAMAAIEKAQGPIDLVLPSKAEVGGNTITVISEAYQEKLSGVASRFPKILTGDRELANSNPDRYMTLDEMGRGVLEILGAPEKMINETIFEFKKPREMQGLGGYINYNAHYSAKTSSYFREADREGKRRVFVPYDENTAFKIKIAKDPVPVELRKSYGYRNTKGEYFVSRGLEGTIPNPRTQANLKEVLVHEITHALIKDPETGVQGSWFIKSGNTWKAEQNNQHPAFFYDEVKQNINNALFENMKEGGSVSSNFEDTSSPIIKFVSQPDSDLNFTHLKPVSGEPISVRFKNEGMKASVWVGDNILTGVKGTVPTSMRGAITFDDKSKHKTKQALVLASKLINDYDLNNTPIEQLRAQLPDVVKKLNDLGFDVALSDHGPGYHAQEEMFAMSNEDEINENNFYNNNFPDVISASKESIIKKGVDLGVNVGAELKLWKEKLGLLTKKIGTPFMVGMKYPKFAPVYQAIGNNMVDKKHEVQHAALKMLDLNKINKIPEYSKVRVTELHKVGQSPTVKDYFTPQQLMDAGMNPAEIEAYGNITRLIKFGTKMEIATQKIQAGIGDMKPEEQEEMSKLIEKRVKALGAYFPTTRGTGKYAVYAPPEEEGGVPYFNRFETQSQANDAAAKIKDARTYTKQDLIAKGVYTKLTAADLENLIASAEMEDRDLKSPALEALRKELASRGFNKHYLRRRGDEGFEWTWDNMIKSAKEYATAASNRYTRALGLRDAYKEFKAVANEMSPALRAYTHEFIKAMEDTHIVGTPWLSNVIYHWRLALNFNHALCDSTQPIFTILPTLAKTFGGVGAEKVLGECYALYGRYARENLTGKASGLSTELKGLLGKLDRQGRFGTHVLNELLSQTNKGLNSVQEISTLPQKLTEYQNRVVAAIAGYKVALHKGLTDKDIILQEMKTMIGFTQFEYGQLNMPVIIKQFGVFSNPAKSMYQFKTYSFSYLSTVLRNLDFSRGATAGSAIRQIGTLLGGAGIKGIPFMALLALAYQKFAGRTLDHDVRSKADEAGVPEMATDIALKGLPAAAGVDMSSSMGLGDIIPTYGSIMESIAGSPYGFFRDMKTGADNLTEGNFLRAAEKLTPSAIDHFFKVVRMVKEEGLRTAGGELVHKPSTASLVIRAIGLSPLEEAKAWDAWNAKKVMESSIKEKTSYYTSKLSKQLHDRDIAGYAATWREINNHNKGKPAHSMIVINSTSIASNLALRQGIDTGGIARQRPEASRIERLFGVKKK